MTSTDSSTSTPYSAALPEGSILDRYRIERVLGKGGFGITYLAHDTSSQQLVVIKENLPLGLALRDPHSDDVLFQGSQEDYENTMRSFINEAQLLSRCQHAHIIGIQRAFEANNTAYYIMDYVGGQTLKQLSDQRSSEPKWSQADIQHLLPLLLEALAYLHDQGILHRDIKPSNILLVAGGDPVLIDFGMARESNPEHSQTVALSLGYTPIEQMSRRGKTGSWTDIYALGCTLYKLMTGEDPAPSLDRLTPDQDPVIPLAQRDDMAHYELVLRRSIDKAMSFAATERWQSARDWKAALTAVSSAQRSQPKTPPASAKTLIATNERIKEIVRSQIAQRGREANLNNVDVSQVTDMSSLFAEMDFNGDISQWDVSKVTDMNYMFYNSPFNGDISQWDVSQVTNMGGMFNSTPFNGDISQWNVSQITDMSSMFVSSQFNGDISQWDVSQVTDMSSMFASSQFNGDISQWDVSQVVDMNAMFELSRQFNGDISQWDVSQVSDMNLMFHYTEFNGDISQWDVSRVSDMDGMFSSSQFNGDISQWDVSRVISMNSMFSSSQFNGDISQWDVSRVTDMESMFQNSQFNGDISQWDVSQVTDTRSMFASSQFNGNISQWNINRVTDMSKMFDDAPIIDHFKPLATPAKVDVKQRSTSSFTIIIIAIALILASIIYIYR